MRADSADSTEVARVFGAIDQKFGKIDVLVNNAAIIARHSRLQNLEFERMRRIFAANGKGAEPFACERLTVALKKKKALGLCLRALSGAGFRDIYCSFNLARPAGIEPATPAFGGQYSIH
jgi:NAD(P)-dependent dehydrogenase (short-subunit alcohol dehydrogenase family)